MMATTGPGAPEVVQTYARARALGAQGGEAPQGLPTLWGLWQSSQSRGVTNGARLAEQLVRRRRGRATRRARVQAHDALGATLFQLGDYTAAWYQFAQALALCDPTTQRDQALHNVAAPGVRCLVVGANALWCLGFPHAGGAAVSGGARPGPGAGPSYSLVVAQHFAAFLHCHRRRGAGGAGAGRDAPGHGHGGVFRSTPGMGTAGGAGRGPCRGGGGGPGRDAPGPDAGRGRGARARAATLAGAARRGGGHVGQVAAGRRLLAEALAAFAASGQGDLLAEAHRLQGELWWRQIRRIRPKPTPVSSRRWRSPGSSRPGPGSCAPR